MSPATEHLHFRALSPTSVADVIGLFGQIRQSPGAEFFHPHPLDEAEAKRLCALTGKDYYCLAYLGEKPVGYGMLRGWDAGYAEPSLGIALDPSFIGRGLGEALTLHLHGVAASRGAASIRLKVYTRNQAARSLYLKLGYVFAPLTEGEELGRLNLAPSLRLGILARGFVLWSGGVDFLCGLISALLATPSANHADIIVFLPSLPERAFTRSYFRNIARRLWLTLTLRPDAPPPSLDAVRDRLSSLSPRIKIVEVGNDEFAHIEAVQRWGIDVAFPSLVPSDFGAACAVVGYLYDFQHRHLPAFFSPQAIRLRDQQFRYQLDHTDVVIVNARSVVDDAQRFMPGTPARLVALPFTPATNKEWIVEIPGVVARYGITGRYFIICNQFWMHKDHRTAVRAFDRLAAAHPEVQLVCTGSTADSRAPNYFPSLQAEIRRLGLDERILILGLIPKRDQIELLKGAIALIQPTLFEGGPGGGSAFDAIGLDVPVILSDIPVNREVDCGRVSFFAAGDDKALTACLLESMSRTEQRADETQLLNQTNHKLVRCGETLWNALMLARQLKGQSANRRVDASERS